MAESNEEKIRRVFRDNQDAGVKRIRTVQEERKEHRRLLKGNEGTGGIGKAR
jgi:hypothetical protein